MLPIINDGELRASFSRNRRQWKNHAKIESAMRTPRPVYNEAVTVEVPCVEQWKVKFATDSIAFYINKPFLKSSPKSVLVAMSDFQNIDPCWQRPRLEELTFLQKEIGYPEIVKLAWIY